MKYNRFKIENIEIGDGIYFDSTPAQSNYDLYWKVIDKLEKQNQLIVQLDEMGFNDLRWTVDVSEVRSIEKRPNND